MDDSGPQLSPVRARGKGGSSDLVAPLPGADYNLRILWTLARWIEDHGGPGALERLTAGTGVSPDAFDRKSEWVSLVTFETLLARARATMPDDDTFMRACAYRFQDAYGAIRYVLWAASPGAVYALGVKSYHLVSTVGKPSIAAQERTHFHMRIASDGRTISRLTCLLRQAQCMALPTLWGLPAGHLKEEACIAHGDATCELHFRWYLGRSWIRVLAGATAFGGMGLLLARLGVTSTPGPWFLALLGASFGYVLEGLRTERINKATREGVMDALRALAIDESEARLEVLELGRRQKEWTRLVEEQVNERTEALASVVQGMQGLQEERVSRVLGFSHDLRNPLQILQFAAETVRVHNESRPDPELQMLTSDMDGAVTQMKRMLSDLVTTASGQRGLVLPLAPERIEITELTERLRRRLRALVFGRDVRSTVFSTREAPEAVEVDPLLLDRIVDNLLTNAAKYTERGSIIVALEGKPGFLIIKVSDTGRGIDPDQLKGSFAPGGSDPAARAGDSFGVGLSIVVQLLDQIGGRLEVMSTLDLGTTFWVHLPIRAAAAPDGPRRLPGKKNDEEALSRVVYIRKSTA